ncbi:MAG: O-methyltransferase [Planctomycetota bacterium]
MIVDDSVARYLEEVAPASEGVLAEMEAYGAETEFPLIGPLVGRVLGLLARSIRAERVFECGSGFGYSAWWFAEAVGPKGEVFLTDLSQENLDRAKDFLARGGLDGRCRFLCGDAVEQLTASYGTYDAILVDIDKEGYPDSLAATVPKLRTGGLLITDNVLWGGRVADESETDDATEAIREYTRRLYANEDLSTVILPLRDGVAVSRKS